MKNLKVFFVCFSMFLISACLQIQNSFENDARVYSPVKALDLTDPAQARLSAARGVFAKYNCTGCHASSNPIAFATMTDSEWKSYYVRPGDPVGSKVIQRIRRRDCSGGDCNMPTSGAEVSESDMTILRDWISLMP